MCTDVFSHCFDEILLLGDLWPGQMGCSNIPSAQACFKPRFHDYVPDSGSNIETGVVDTMSLSNSLTQMFDQEIGTSLTSDGSRLLVTNSMTHERIRRDVININLGVVSDSGIPERTQSVTESSKLITTERIVVTDELREQHLSTVNHNVENIINASDQENSTTTVVTNGQEETTTALLESATAPTCEAVIVESCSKYYNATILPNNFGHETQLQAEEPLVRLIVSVGDVNSRYCAGYLESTMCASLLPPCDTGELTA